MGVNAGNNGQVSSYLSAGNHGDVLGLFEHLIPEDATVLTDFIQSHIQQEASLKAVRRDDDDDDSSNDSSDDDDDSQGPRYSSKLSSKDAQTWQALVNAGNKGQVSSFLTAKNYNNVLGLFEHLLPEDATLMTNYIQSQIQQEEANMKLARRDDDDDDDDDDSDSSSEEDKNDSDNNNNKSNNGQSTLSRADQTTWNNIMKAGAENSLTSFLTSRSYGSVLHLYENLNEQQAVTLANYIETHLYQEADQ